VLAPRQHQCVSTTRSVAIGGFSSRFSSALRKPMACFLQGRPIPPVYALTSTTLVHRTRAEISGPRENKCGIECS